MADDIIDTSRPCWFIQLMLWGHKWNKQNLIDDVFTDYSKTIGEPLTRNIVGLMYETNSVAIRLSMWYIHLKETYFSLSNLFSIILEIVFADAFTKQNEDILIFHLISHKYIKMKDIVFKNEQIT